MKKQFVFAMTLLIITALSACGSQTDQTPPEPATATEAAVQPTQPSAATETAIVLPTDTEIPLVPTEAATTDTTSAVSFANNVMPIFENSCISCHGGERTKEGLDMKTYESLMAGSFNGSVLEAGNADGSYLVEQLINGEMPKRGDKLSESEIQIIIDWINAGALNN